MAFLPSRPHPQNGLRIKDDTFHSALRDLQTSSSKHVPLLPPRSHVGLQHPVMTH